MSLRDFYKRLRAEASRPIPARFDNVRIAEILAALLVLMIAGDTLTELDLAALNSALARCAVAVLLGLWAVSFTGRLGWWRPWVVKVAIGVFFFVGPAVQVVLAWYGAK